MRENGNGQGGPECGPDLDVGKWEFRWSVRYDPVWWREKYNTLKKLCRDVECKLILEERDMVRRVQEHLESNLNRYELDSPDSVAAGRATYEDGVLRIVIEDYPPQEGGVGAKTAKEREKLWEHWIVSVFQAVERLRKDGVSIPARPRAYCQITVYKPKTNWGMSNLMIQPVVDALCYAGVLSCALDKTVLMVRGGVDKQRPRTEIRVIPVKEDFPDVWSS